VRADGAEFAVAEEAGEFQGAERTGDEPGVVVGPAEEVGAAAVADAQAAAVNRPAGEVGAGAGECSARSAVAAAASRN